MQVCIVYVQRMCAVRKRRQLGAGRASHQRLDDLVLEHYVGRELSGSGAPIKSKTAKKIAFYLLRSFGHMCTLPLFS